MSAVPVVIGCLGFCEFLYSHLHQYMHCIPEHWVKIMFEGSNQKHYITFDSPWHQLENQVSLWQKSGFKSHGLVKSNLMIKDST